MSNVTYKTINIFLFINYKQYLFKKVKAIYLTMHKRRYKTAKIKRIDVLAYTFNLFSVSDINVYARA